jgi:uncharacterized protein involved in outer membrane biogenesis
MRRLTKIAVALALVFVALLAGKNLIIKMALERIFAQTTEFTLTVQDIRVGIFKPVVDVRGLKLTNPPDFPEPDAIEVDKMYIHYDVFSLLGDNIRFKEIILDIPRVAMVTNEKGESNMERLEAAASPPATAKTAPPPPREGEPGAKEPGTDFAGGAKAPESEPQASGPESSPKAKTKRAPDVEIDKLTFRLGEVRIRDYSRSRNGDDPRSMTIQLNVDRTYTDLKGVKTIGAKIAAEVAAYTVAFYIKDVGRKMQEGGDTEKIKDFFQGLGDMFKGKKKKSK